MDLYQALFLGLLQGLTEFLPISSSGHLVVAPQLLGWPAHSLAFDVALHLGTAAALVAFFWREWLALLRALGTGLLKREARADGRWKLAWMLALGSVPAGLAGLAFEEPVERLLRQPTTVALALAGFGAVMWLVDRLSRRQRKLQDLGYADALLIGLAQVLALWPGVSRAGATICAGLALGLTREAAARFSFLLATPIVVAAGGYKLVKDVLMGGLPAAEGLAFAAGTLTSFLVGLLAIGFLLRFLQRNSLAAFALYRLVVGAAILLVVVWS